MTKKAIVLAAGFGNRLRPFTCAVPKPLLPVWGEPMLERIIGLLASWGVDDIVVNCHYLHEQVEAFVADLAAAAGDKMRIRAAYEPEILGTGGVMNPLRDWIGGDDFLLVNGDIVLEGLDDISALELPNDPAVIGTCLVAETGPRTLEIEPTLNYVTNWHSDDAGWSGTFTYCGLAHLRAAILDFVAPTGMSSLVAAYEKAMMEGRFMRAVRVEGLLWTDAGTVASYLEINANGDENAYAHIPQLKAVFGENAGRVDLIGSRGSDRVFFRCGEKIGILYDDTTRGENARYEGHARFLAAHGIPVPAVLASRPDLKTLVLANAGGERKMTLEEYVKVVETLAAFNALDASALSLEPEMDASLWAWERDLFREFCLGARYRREMPANVEKELQNVAAILEKEPRALVHRDFQSTNVLWRSGKMSIIDFQGMRLGPAAYDLASLVYDPYATFTEGERRALVALYAKKSGRENMPRIVPFAAVQRLVQCLGAYGRLASVGQPQFGRFVMPALQNLLDAADRAGLDAVGALAEDLIALEGHPHDTCSCHDHGHDHDHSHNPACGEENA